MSTVLEAEARAAGVRITDAELTVELEDGRTLTVPLSWFPRLAYGTPSERAEVQIVGGGVALHWPQLDEDVSVNGLLAGRKAAERTESLTRWMAEMDRRRSGGHEAEPWGEAWPLPEDAPSND